MLPPSRSACPSVARPWVALNLWGYMAQAAPVGCNANSVFINSCCQECGKPNGLSLDGQLVQYVVFIG